MVLIFTNKEDAHPNLVIDYLYEWGVPFFRLNTEELLAEYSFCWSADYNGCDFEIINRENGSMIRGSEITSLWDRRPEPPSILPIRNSEIINNHIREEALEFLRYLRYYLDNIPSIGSIVYDRVASSKMLQYKVALDCGLSIPATVFSNRKNAFELLGGLYQDLCIKGIGGHGVWDARNMADYVFYTSKLDSREMAAIPEEAFTQTVSFLQEYVPKAFELRVTVVDEDVFAARIDTQDLDEDKGKVDWRQGYDSGLRLSEFILPETIKDKCLALVHALGLNFGCIDLIVRPDGEYVFLECNPNGQWLWVELQTGMKISESIARFLSTNRPIV
ncbi:MAG: hypothetical protein IKH00_02570 [Bacteroidales bacterium]|nr:hypothetical protein [Bacteroidales bacterium]